MATLENSASNRLIHQDVLVERWTCPNCKRVFGKKNQSHLTCEPAMSIGEYFEGARPFERPIFEAVFDGLRDLEGLIVDPLNVGILLKNGPMFAELRPKTKWTALGFSLGRKLESNRLSRKVVDYGKKYFHVINVTDPAQIDDQTLEWLREAYHVAGGTLSEFKRGGEVDRDGDGDGMVPDDIDELDDIF